MWYLIVSIPDLCTLTYFPYYCNASSHYNNPIELKHNDNTNNRARKSQIVWAKKNIKLSHGGHSQRHASGTNQPIKALRQDLHWVWCLTHHRAIKEETIAINRDKDLICPAAKEIKQIIYLTINSECLWYNLENALRSLWYHKTCKKVYQHTNIF